VKKYSVWSTKDDPIGHTLMEGLEPLTFNDGSKDPDAELMLYSFEAETFEEAMSIYYIRQGWVPYKRDGEAEPCPKCGALYYPKGSGECWQCHYNSYA
jgi:hypothetical protein